LLEDGGRIAVRSTVRGQIRLPVPSPAKVVLAIGVSKPTALVRDWIERFGDAGGADLTTDLDRFKELRDAVVPAGWTAVAADSSYLAAEDDTIRGELRAHLVPPGVDFGVADEDELGTVGVTLDTFERYAELETLNFPPDVQMLGFGRLVVGGLVVLGDELGLELIIVNANRVGRYAWARCGFEFMEGQRDRVVTAAEEFARSLGRAVDLSGVRYPWEITDLPGTVTLGEIEAAGGPPAPPGQRDTPVKLGRALLLGPPLDANCWDGQLRLQHESPGRVRLDRYVLRHADGEETTRRPTPQA
jgi:hypothetical protein